MKSHLTALAAAMLAAILPTAANADVSYLFAGSFMADTDGDSIDELYEWSFNFTQPTFIASLTEVTPDACSISGSFYTCSATQTIDPTSQSFGSIGAAYLGFNVTNVDQSGGGTSFYFFPEDAFTTFGAHVAENPPPGSGVGNAGPASLLLSGTIAGGVPEPATWAMMIGGFGFVGGAMRARRRTYRTTIAA